MIARLSKIHIELNYQKLDVKNPGKQQNEKKTAESAMRVYKKQTTCLIYSSMRNPKLVLDLTLNNADKNAVSSQTSNWQPIQL